MNNRGKIDALISEIVPDHGGIHHVREGVVSVEPPPGMCKRWEITFDKLKQLSIALGTTYINLRYDSGWEGSEVTGGDPGTMELHIEEIEAE